MRWWWVPLYTRPTHLVCFYRELQSAERHVAPLGHIILIPSQPVFALSSNCCILIGEATNTNFIVFGLTRLGREHTIYHTWGENANYYTTNAAKKRFNEDKNWSNTGVWLFFSPLSTVSMFVYFLCSLAH